ncbi:MAG: hypothetical protein JKX89_01095 [Idiomarina sp.]|nr:hypothetical protein [Idiomarina sp.]
MEKAAETKGYSSESNKLPKCFYSSAGLKVEVHAEKWKLAPYGQGHTIDVSWLKRLSIDPELQRSFLELLISYSETKSSGTVATISFALQSGFPEKVKDLDSFKVNWATLKSSTKKTLKGCLGAAVKYDLTILIPYYDVVKTYQHKPKFNGLSPTKGRLSDYEYDSILENVRRKCEELPEASQLSDDFFFNQKALSRSLRFYHYRNTVCYRTLIQLARRPRQISFLKWCDILPIGVSFNRDTKEPIQTNLGSLHVRSFVTKQAGSGDSFRKLPEKWTIPLSESFSALIIKYKRVFVEGVRRAISRQELDVSSKVFDEMINNMPVFPYSDIFHCDFRNDQLIKQQFSSFSTAFHMSESNIDHLPLSYGKGVSERHGTCVGSTNRLRHTWLCNAALQGMSINDICKITNVSQPAARYYLQLGLKERQFIDENYAANDFLRNAFNPKPFLTESDRQIESQLAGCVGVENAELTCETCIVKRQMTRPIPCYGCPNFRPLLDGNHEEVLKQAEEKRAYLRKIGSPDIYTGSTQKLEKCISYIKLTIEMCKLIKVENKSLSNKKHSHGN